MLRNLINFATVLLLAALAACAPSPGAPPDEATQPPAAAPSATPEASETPAPTATLIAAATTTPLPGALVPDWTSTSPDGQWTATAYTADLFAGGDYYTRLRVEGSTGAQVWTPVDEWRPMGLGFTLPALLQWSADGRRLYFTNLPHPDGCSQFVNGGDLQVLDLATGQVTELMPEQGLWLALSPDEARLAYIGYGDRGLVIRDLATRQEQPISVPRPSEGAPLGAVGWAPDGRAVALTAAHDQCSLGGPRSVLVANLETGVVETVVDADSWSATSIRWDEAGLVVVNRDGVETVIEIQTS
jgi:hypothetical protein